MYECVDCGTVTEEFRPMSEGPYPAPYCPNMNHVGEGIMRVRIQPSLLVFGDFIRGDDDFSRRYHLNGEAGKYGGKKNRTQGQTNVNGLMRKYGKEGRPLEMNPDIDPTKPWDTTKGPPPGVDPNTVAPIEMQSSMARGMKLKDES